MPTSRNKSTILTLLDTPAYGGAEQYVLDCSVLLNKNGHKIIIYTNNDHVREQYQKYIQQTKIKNFEVNHLPYLLDAMGDWKGLIKFFFHAPKACLWFYRTLKEIKQKEKNVTCFFVAFTDRLLFSPIVKFLKAKLIWVEIGPLPPVFKRNWGFPKLLYFATKKFPDHFATTSKFTMSTMINNANIDQNNITLIYPGIKVFSLKEISQFKNQGKIWRKKNVKEKILIGFVGRMAQENEVALLIMAFKKVLSYFNSTANHVADLDIHLVIIGDGPDKSDYVQLAKDLKIDDKITFTGFVTTQKKFQILSICELFVFSRSWSWDGFGMTTIEAMSVKVPVISPNFGPQKEIVNNLKNGLNFKSKNINDLAKQIIKLAKSEKLRQQFSKNGYQTAVKKFSYSQTEMALLTAISKAEK